MLAATQILAKVDQKYRECLSYADSGSVFQWEHGATPAQTAVLTFKTYFVRPNKLRVEWTHDGELNVIWSDGTNHRALYSSQNQTEECKDIEMLVASATGVSMGVAFLIPTLLIPAIREEANHLLKVLLPSVDEQQSENHDYCIRASAHRENDTVISISQDFAIQAVREETVISADESRQMFEDACKAMNEQMNEDMTYQESHYFQKTVYETTVFDSTIDSAIFDYRS